MPDENVTRKELAGLNRRVSIVAGRIGCIELATECVEAADRLSPPEAKPEPPEWPRTATSINARHMAYNGPAIMGHEKLEVYPAGVVGPVVEHLEIHPHCGRCSVELEAFRAACKGKR